MNSMIKNNDENFDELVERFLKKQLSQDEEEAFKEELAKDTEKLRRAKSIALAVKGMRNTQKKSDKDIIRAIKEIPQETAKKIIEDGFYDDFDARIESFLKGSMSPAQEKELKKELYSSPELLSRAKIIGLIVFSMKNKTRKKDYDIIESIKKIETTTLQTIGKCKNTKKILRLWPISIAVSILILLGLYVHHYDINQVKFIGNKYGNEFTEISLTRSSDYKHDSIAVSELSSIICQMNDDDSIPNAIVKLETIYKKYNRKNYDINNKYYNNDYYMAYVAWHLSIAYLKIGNKKEAVPILNSIIKNYEGTPMAKKAAEILEKL